MRKMFVGVRCRACGQPFEAHIQKRPMRVRNRLQFLAFKCDKCGHNGLYPREELDVFIDLGSNPYRTN